MRRSSTMALVLALALSSFQLATPSGNDYQVFMPLLETQQRVAVCKGWEPCQDDPPLLITATPRAR